LADERNTEASDVTVAHFDWLRSESVHGSARPDERWIEDPWHLTREEQHDSGFTLCWTSHFSEFEQLPWYQRLWILHGRDFGNFGNTWMAEATANQVEAPGSGIDDADEAAAWRALSELAASASWWVFIPPFVLLADPPSRLLYDSEGRLSADDRPAVEYRDGTGVWMVEGRRVPVWWSTPAQRTLGNALGERDPADRIRLLDLLADEAFKADRLGDLVAAEHNAEVRRHLIERLGLDRIVDALQARQISKDRFGELWVVPRVMADGPAHPRTWQRTRREETPAMKFVKVVDATPHKGERREYWLAVPPEMTSARQAVAWTFGLDTYEYRPEVET